MCVYVCVCVILVVHQQSSVIESSYPHFSSPVSKVFFKKPIFFLFFQNWIVCVIVQYFVRVGIKKGKEKIDLNWDIFFGAAFFHSFEVMGENDTILFRFPVYVCVCVCNETTENPFPACTIVIGSFVNAKWRPTHDKRLKRKEKKTLYLWRASSIHKHTTILPHRSIYIYTINIYIYFRMFQRETHF